MVPLGIAAADPQAAAAADAAQTGADPAARAAIATAIAAGIAGASEADVVRLAGGSPGDAALAGALRGAALGRTAFSPQEALAVLTCRPDERLGVARPRLDTQWADDVADLAEALLLRRTVKGTA
jgi:hypothetical protein